MKELNVKVGDKVRFIRKWEGTSPCYDVEVGTVATVKKIYDTFLYVEVPGRDCPFGTERDGMCDGFRYIEAVPTYNIGDKIIFNKPLECFNKGDVAEITASKATGYSWNDLFVKSVTDNSVTGIVNSDNEAFSLYKEEDVVKTAPNYLTFPEVLHALADGKAVTVAKENPYIATGVTYHLKDNELTVKAVQGKSVGQKAMYKLEHLAKVGLVFATETKPWYEDLEGKPRLCWVWYNGDPTREKQIEVITSYDHKKSHPYRSKSCGGCGFDYATPLTKEEIQTYLDNA